MQPPPQHNPNATLQAIRGQHVVVRCGTIICWRISSTILVIVGAIALSVAGGVYVSGDPSMSDCAHKDSYSCSKGCWKESAYDDLVATNSQWKDCPETLEWVTKPCSDAKITEASKYCKCVRDYTCDKARGVYLAGDLSSTVTLDFQVQCLGSSSVLPFW